MFMVGIVRAPRAYQAHGTTTVPKPMVPVLPEASTAIETITSIVLHWKRDRCSLISSNLNRKWCAHSWKFHLYSIIVIFVAALGSQNHRNTCCNIGSATSWTIYSTILNDICKFFIFGWWQQLPVATVLPLFKLLKLNTCCIQQFASTCCSRLLTPSLCTAQSLLA